MTDQDTRETPRQDAAAQDESASCRPLDEIDRVIHEPARMMIMALLSEVQGADFLFLRKQTGLTAGNLSSHLSKLEDAGYVAIEKTFRGKVPHTLVGITPEGADAFASYRASLGDVLGL